MIFPDIANYGCGDKFPIYIGEYRQGDIILKRRVSNANRDQCHMNK